MAHFLWWIGEALEWAHIPVLLSLMVFGRLWMSMKTQVVVAGCIVTAQAACLGCPITLLVELLKHPYEPSYTFTGSLTWDLYHKWGPEAAVPIFLSSILLSGLVAKLWWAYVVPEVTEYYKDRRADSL
jgi:hypothetical protein